MAKRKTDDELIAELKLFNHHESARRMEELIAENKRLRTPRCNTAGHENGCPTPVSCRAT